MRVGVIDVGTNSVRVLVAEETDGSIRDLERDLIITRLGEGVDRDKRVKPEALRRTVAAIAGYAERCRAHEVEAIRIIATSAVRDAANRDDFTAAVQRATGTEPVLLSGDEEAQLGFLGATMGLTTAPPYLVVDIGGGSTELVRGSERAERFISLDIGSVRLTERHVRTDPPPQGEIDAVAADADEHLAEALRALGDESGGTLLGLAGTITTTAAIALELPGYDREAIHHAKLTRRMIADVCQRLMSMTSEQRRALPAMPRGREDVIIAGVVILERVMARFSFEECLVSETDILDGTALDLLRSPEAAADLHD